METFIDIGAILLYVLFGAAILLALVFQVLQMRHHPRKAVALGIGLAGIAILILVSFLLASSGDLPGSFLERYDITANQSRWIGAGVIASLALLVAAVITILATFIHKRLR
ncbi:MAG: hypothetical protein FJY10_04720 [Bacteroidetes bacterium]|nr:hypothetical protein [Bacteroidota bacterium]